MKELKANKVLSGKNNIMKKIGTSFPYLDKTQN